MTTIIEKLQGRKTYILAIGMIVGIVFNTWTSQDFNFSATLAALDWKGIGSAFGLMTLRAGIAKVGQP